MLSHEIVVVGAGPAGSATAFFLASAGHDVLLLDRAAFPRDKTCGDCLSPRALHVARDMGALDAIEARGRTSRRVALFAPCGREIRAAVPGAGPAGGRLIVLPRVELDHLLLERAVAAGATFRAGVRVDAFVEEGGRVAGVAATTGDGPVAVSARTVVLAVGAARPLLERARMLPRRPALGIAARRYFENVAALGDEVLFHFDTVPLPGYGWIFPCGTNGANVGAGYLAGRRPASGSARSVYERFVASPGVAPLLDGARPVGPVKGYPLRFDFGAGPLARAGLHVVGEAAGLVNPLSGEGIDYALESGALAAEVLGTGLARGESPDALAARHDAALRARFLPSFRAIARVRDLYLRRWTFDRLAQAAQKHADLRSLLVEIALGTVDPRAAFRPRVVWQVARG